MTTFDITENEFDQLINENNVTRPFYNQLQQKVVSEWLNTINENLAKSSSTKENIAKT